MFIFACFFVGNEMLSDLLVTEEKVSSATGADENDPKLKKHKESVLELSNNNLVSRSILARLTIFIVLIALILLREKCLL